LKNRRFFFSKEVIQDERFIRFAKEELPYKTAFDIYFTRALNILKVSGSGMQFLHGGLSLQELTIPFITIRKERKEAFDLKKVKIEPIGLMSKLSTYQTIVNILQEEVVGAKIEPIICQMGFYDLEGKAISNIIDFTFDSQDEEIRRRETKHKFSFSDSLFLFNGEKIYFIISEKHKNSTKYVEYFKKAINVFIGEEKDDFDL